MIVTNTRELESWLAAFGEGPVAARLVQLALVRAVLKDLRLFVRCAAPAEADDLTIAMAVERSEPLHRFDVGRAASLVHGDVLHVADWLNAAVASDATWLSRTDELGRPLKLLKIGSIAQAVREADKAMAAEHSRHPKPRAGFGDGESALADLGDGWTLVALRTPEALDRESSLMRHCIGHGAYDARLERRTARLLSVRGPDGRPVATIHLELSGLATGLPRAGIPRSVRFVRRWRVAQISGRRNGMPPPEASRRAVRWFESNGVPLSGDDIAHMGLIRLEDGLAEKGRVPEGAVLAKGNVRLSGSIAAGRLLAPGVRVRGDLGIMSVGKAEMPEGARIDGNMTVDIGSVSIPGSVSIGGVLDLTMSSGTAHDFGFSPDRPFPSVGKLVFCRREQVGFVPDGYVERVVRAERTPHLFMGVRGDERNHVALVAREHAAAFDRVDGSRFLRWIRGIRDIVPKRGTEERVLMAYAFASIETG